MKDTVGEADTLSPAAAGLVPGAGERYGHYALGAVLGRGGMGEVMSATDERIGRPVAIKRMRGSDPQSIARFIREAKIQARLDHPAIVPVHEIGQDTDGKPVIVMKQLRGTTLAELLRRLDGGDQTLAARFTRQRLLRAFADVCLAVEFAHSRGVVHRDLKPANITLGEFGEVYVLDWGVAKVQDDSALPASGSAHVEAGATVAGTILGTPGYMAPEQARGDEVDERADVYALGCVLFEILTGQPLDRPGEPTRAGTDAGRPSTRSPDRAIAPELDAVCVRATAPDRAARFASARELGTAVEHFLDGDRDVEQRRRLSEAALTEAREALARGRDDAKRRLAMRAASRALSLEPASHEAAALVATLLLEPPRDVPDEVERELARQEIAAIHDQRGRAALSVVAVALLIPFLYWAGIRHPLFIAILGASCALFGAARLIIVRNDRIHRGFLALLLVGLIGTVATMSYAASVALAAPIAVMVTGRLNAQHRLAPGWLVGSAMTLAVAMPPLLGLAGCIPSTIDIAGADVRLHLLTDHLQPAGMVSWLLFIPLMIAMTVSVTRNATEPLRAARRATLLQAWWLRQLVPTEVTREASPAPAR